MMVSEYSALSTSTSFISPIDTTAFWLIFARAQLSEKSEPTFSCFEGEMLKMDIAGNKETELPVGTFQFVIESLKHVVTSDSDKSFTPPESFTTTLLKWHDHCSGKREQTLTDILSRLLGLLQSDPEDDEYVVPSDAAVSRTSDILIGASTFREREIPLAAVSASDEGDVRTEWLGEKKQISLVVPSNEEHRAYIFHEDQDGYGIEWNVSSDVLAKFLDWFESKSQSEWT
ncbi:MAG: hypothetical protein K1X83_05175 [Oligoflexia bacterium]|nr:hypothetical protein [Oligoflexia bacterium]